MPWTGPSTSSWAAGTTSRSAPHPCGSYQIAFAPELFGALVPWLALNRDGLTVFIHPETGDDLPDHRDYAIWLGRQEALNLEVLR